MSGDNYLSVIIIRDADVKADQIGAGFQRQKQRLSLSLDKNLTVLILKCRSITNSSPILHLPSLGAIAHIDDSLYLILDELLAGFVPIASMLNLHDYFLRPQSLRLSFRSISTLERHTISYFVSFLQEIIKNNPNGCLSIVDMERLGKLVVSNNKIQYLNGQHNWKYQKNRNLIKLPTLLQNCIEKTSEEKMARKFSHSIKKFSGNSLGKNNEKKVKLVRPNSVIKFQTGKELSGAQEQSLKNNRVATESFQRMAKSRSKNELEKLKIYQREKLLIKTEPSSQYDTAIKRSSPKSSVQKNRLSSGKKPARTEIAESRQGKKKLILGGQKSNQTRVLSVRQKLTIKSDEQINHNISVISFIQRSTKNAMAKFTEEQITKIQDYFHQLAHIYLQKQEQIQQNRFNKIKLITEQNKIAKIQKIKSKIDFIKIQQIFISFENYSIYNIFYKLIQESKSKYTQNTKSYIINFEEKIAMIQQLAKQIEKNLEKIFEKKILMPIGLLCHKFLQFLYETEQNLLLKIGKNSNQLIVIMIIKQTSFREDIIQFVQKIQAIFEPIIQCLRNHFPKLIWIQQHQLEKIRQLKIKFHCSLAKHIQQIDIFFGRMSSSNLRTVLDAFYHSEKEGLSEIRKLQILKNNIQNEIDFKFQLRFPGVLFNLKLIKQQYLTMIKNKYYEIYLYFYKQYQKNEAQLSNRLKTIIVINVDFLSDYKCRQYREEIEDNYKSLLQSLLLIVNHFSHLLTQSELRGILYGTYDFKAQIHQNFINFIAKLEQYRSSSNKTIKTLQQLNRKHKQIYQQLSQKLKKLLNSLSSQRTLIDAKPDILSLDAEFLQYSNSNHDLMQSMKQNEMVYWQDDQFFINNITLLKQSVDFLQGKSYRVFLTLPLTDLSISDLYSAFEDFKFFVQRLVETRLQKLFRPTFSLLQNNLLLAQLLLYKQYTEFQLQKCKQLGIDVAGERGSRLLPAIKRYQSLEKKKIEKIVELYRQSRLNQFNLYHDEGYESLRLERAQGAYQIQYITNLQELKQYLQLKNSLTSATLLELLLKLQEIYKQILLFNKMIYLISQITLPEGAKEAILARHNGEYTKLLTLKTSNIQLTKFEQRLNEEKLKFMQICYHQKVAVFTRYALCSIPELVQLSQWRSNQNITQNIKTLFSNVDEVGFDEEGNIIHFQVGKDYITFDRPFNIFEKPGEIAKIVYLHTENFLRDSLVRSQFSPVYVKILAWHIYFTQQVQLYLMTQNSLIRLRQTFKEIIQEIASQVRYDLKLHHKTYEIAQLNFFISHIDRLKEVTHSSNFQWISTIRYYQKLKVVKVEQNDRTHDYSFEVKRPMSYDPGFKLQTSISYGFKESYVYYQMSAYILGKPFVTFKTLSDYGFQTNYTVLMNFIKKFQYFICVIVHFKNYKSLNYFHKKILEFSLKKLGPSQQQTLNMPVFFQYQGEATIPLCFPEKYRNFSHPEFGFDLNLIVLLHLDRYQSIIQRSCLNVQVLLSALSLINVKKNLTMKKAISFVQNLAKLLESVPQRQQIYKFCYRYFVVNYQVNDSQLSTILAQLIKETNLDLQSIAVHQKTFIKKFIKGSKNILIYYGPQSHKTHLLSSLGIPIYNGQQNTLMRIQGIEQFFRIKKQNIKLSFKVIIQDRFIHHIEPKMIADSQLLYSTELPSECIRYIFSKKIEQLKIEGNYEVLWSKFCCFYDLFSEISLKSFTLLGAVSLITRCYASHVFDFLTEVEAEEQQKYRLSVNKETIRSFIIICHEIFYYMLESEERKKFTERLKEMPLMQECRNEELQNITCRGLTCEKILNLIKKEKITFRSIGNFTKQFIILKKYLHYKKPVVIYANSYVMKKLLRQQISALQYNKIDINLSQEFLSIIRRRKYKDILYIVHDIHLENKPNLTFLKSRLQLKDQQDYYLMTSENNSFNKAMKYFIGFNFSEIQAQDIYKFQNKEGITDQVQLKCKTIWNNNYFSDESTYLMFLINISVKLPSQYYKKFFARQMIYTKFNPNILVVKTIGMQQQTIRKISDVASLSAYLIESKGHSQQLTESQVIKRIQKATKELNFVQKTLAKECYKQILPFVLADKPYIIKEDICILPILINGLHERKLYKISKINFASCLIQVIQQIYETQKQCTVVIQQPLASSKEFEQFIKYYLKGIDIINHYPEIRQYTELAASKYQYVYRLQDQSIPIKNKVNDIIYSKIKLIISQTPTSRTIVDPNLLYINNIIYLNCLLTSANKQFLIDALINRQISNFGNEISEILLKIKPYIIKLIEDDLLYLNRIQNFLTEIVKVIKGQIQEIGKFKQILHQKKKLFQSLQKIRLSLDVQFKEISIKQNTHKQFLNRIMEIINNFGSNQTAYVEKYHYEQLIKIRQDFACSTKKTYIWIQQSNYQVIYSELAQVLPEGILRVEQGAPIMQISLSYFVNLICNNKIEICLQFIVDKYKQERESQFILIKYIKFMLSVCRNYRNINYQQCMAKREVQLMNYYYLLDVCVQLKLKQCLILEQYDSLGHKKNLIQNFTDILSTIEHIQINEQQLFNYHIFNRIKRIIRSYSIQGQEYNLNKFLNNYNKQFLIQQKRYEQYLLKQNEQYFMNINKQCLLQQINLIIFDPYNRIQSICNQLSIKIIYVNSQQDLQQLYDYKFKMTVFCIKIKTLQYYYQNQILINNCLSIIQRKHTDLQSNILQKLVISIDDKNILSAITYHFPIINLGYTFISFLKQFENRTFQSRYKWKSQKDQYLILKKRLRKQIELIKTLNSDEISLYIIKLQSLINQFKKKHEQIVMICDYEVFTQQNIIDIEMIFRSVLRLHIRNEFPFNLSLRLLRHMNMDDILLKYELVKTQGIRQNDDWLKNYLLSNNLIVYQSIQIYSNYI